MARYVLDALNVIGHRPGDWPAEREDAVRRLVARARGLAERTGDEVVVVVDGARIPDLPREGAVRAVFARRRGLDAADDRIVELVEGDRDPRGLQVVTADEGLRRRLRKLGAGLCSPAAFLDRLGA